MASAPMDRFVGISQDQGETNETFGPKELFKAQ